MRHHLGGGSGERGGGWMGHDGGLSHSLVSMGKDVMAEGGQSSLNSEPFYDLQAGRALNIKTLMNIDSVGTIS